MLPILAGAATHAPSERKGKQDEVSQVRETGKPTDPLTGTRAPGIGATSQPAKDKTGRYTFREKQSYWREAFASETVPNWALVAVGIITGGLAWRTLKGIERQALLMKEQADLMAAQAGHMQRQTGILADSVAVAHDSAQVARTQLEMIASKERARILVMVKRSPEVNVPFGIAYTVQCYGTSPARIESGVASAKLVSEAGFIEQAWLLLPIEEFPVLLEAGSDAKRAVIVNAMPLTSFQMQKIREGELYIHFRGEILYTDIFEVSRKTTFYHSFHATDLKNPDGTIFCCWSKIGPPEANQES